MVDASTSRKLSPRTKTAAAAVVAAADLPSLPVKEEVGVVAVEATLTVETVTTAALWDTICKCAKKS